MKRTGFRYTQNMTIDVKTWLDKARLDLARRENPGVEGLVLVEWATGLNRAAIFAHPEQILTIREIQTLDNALERLISGEPLPYIIGSWEFYGLRFEVTPQVLIPRPETELLVELGLEWLRAHPDRRKAADVGTGSACIAAALAYHLHDLNVLAVDQSTAALKIAARNIKRLEVNRTVSLVACNLLSAFHGSLDFVAANLPYIPTDKLSSLVVSVYEPRSALDGGKDGLVVISSLLSDSSRWLAPGGLMLLEIEAGQGESASQMARKLVKEARVDLVLDLAGRPRVVRIEKDAY